MQGLSQKGKALHEEARASHNEASYKEAGLLIDRQGLSDIGSASHR